MTDPNAYTRREFLGGSLAVLSTITTVPTFLSHSASALAQTTGTPGSPDDRILVVVQLSGGNDGLNTVIPFGAREYYAARPVLGIAENQVLKLDKSAGIGLHPEMTALVEMLDDGLASVVMGVGYPNPNRSHFASMDIWHTADPSGGRGLGWIGKALDQKLQGPPAFHASATLHADATACVCIGAEAPLAAQGQRIKPIAFQNANLFRWVGGDLHAELRSAYDTINRAGTAVAPSIAPGSEAAFVLRTALDAQLASDRIRKAVAQGPITSFPGNELANQLRMVASMIRAELPTRVYYVGLGGFDTHANQPYRHGRLLRNFSEALRAFYGELKAMGQDNRVLTMAFSEFGRRVAQNASNGTDHGTAGPMFLFGPMVKPGLLGKHPTFDQFDDGDLIHTVDFRSIYAGLLEHWLRVDSRAVLGKRFAPASLLKG